ncbi:hypothetical protein LIER_41435 [Lithospermum erythrorhizon]|uniref:CCHC-type domain-containing protein n=1 Tax=Lithospermum erythrorhizon TaxID=34254 RepID=A0AAV3RDB9_LITER
MDSPIINCLLQCVKLSLSKAWNCLDLRVSRVRGSILHIFFPSITEKKRVMSFGPWCYDGQLLVMKERVRGENPLNIRFDECAFWLQVRGLKVEFFTWDVASKLANAFPGCEEVELRREKEGSKFFRVKAVIKICLPLRRMVQFQLGDVVITGYLAYERLPNLCFKCGLLGHLIRQCPQLEANVDLKKECIYDMWIKEPMEKTRIVFKLNMSRKRIEDAMNSEAVNPATNKGVVSQHLFLNREFTSCIDHSNEDIDEDNSLAMLTILQDEKEEGINLINVPSKSAVSQHRILRSKDHGPRLEDPREEVALSSISKLGEETASHNEGGEGALRPLSGTRQSLKLGESPPRLVSGRLCDSSKGGGRSSPHTDTHSTPSKTKDALQFYVYQTPKIDEERIRKGKMEVTHTTKKRYHPYNKVGNRCEELRSHFFPMTELRLLHVRSLADINEYLGMALLGIGSSPSSSSSSPLDKN